MERDDYIAVNVGYLTASKTDESNENYTPYYAVDPIMKYISKDKTIWCPFDEEWSAYYNLFKDKGYKTIRSSIQEGQDFFTYEPEDYDVIVSNPPFNIKDKILKRLDELGKPFAILLPMNSLQGASRYKYCFKNGIQMLAFDKRIGFHSMEKMNTPTEGTPFASAYFCRNILPKDLIVEELHKYEKPLILNEKEKNMNRVYMLIDLNNKLVDSVLMNEFDEEKAIDHFKFIGWKGVFTIVSEDSNHNKRIIGQQIQIF